MQWRFVQALAFLSFQLMVVVGGQAPKAIRSVECYDFKEERWHQVAELPSRRCRAGEPRPPWVLFPQLEESLLEKL